MISSQHRRSISSDPLALFLCEFLSESEIMSESSSATSRELALLRLAILTALWRFAP